MKLTVNGKNIGSYDMSTNTFTSHRKRSKHLFRALNAWGIDYKKLQALLPTNATIKIIDTESNKVYETDAHTFDREGQFYHFKSVNEDHKTQKFLPLFKFKKPPEETEEQKAKRLFL